MHCLRTQNQSAQRGACIECRNSQYRFARRTTTKRTHCALAQKWGVHVAGCCCGGCCVFIVHIVCENCHCVRRAAATRQRHHQRYGRCGPVLAMLWQRRHRRKERRGVQSECINAVLFSTVHNITGTCNSYGDGASLGLGGFANRVGENTPRCSNVGSTGSRGARWVEQQQCVA